MEAEEEIRRTRSNANQETPQNKLVLSADKDSSDERIRGDSEAETNDPGQNRDCSIDIKDVDAVNGVSRNSESTKAERVCRICHLGAESASEGSELIELGCDCKGEIGCSHRHCANAWFWQKGNRRCEICGAMAKNVDDKIVEDTSMFLMEWNDMRLVAATIDDPQASSRRCKQYLCRFLALFLVLAFLLPWLFRGIHVL